MVDCYETIHKLLEAIALKNGFKINEEGAHQELINYVAKEEHLDEQTQHLLQQLRDYRNRTAYEGFTIQKEFIVPNEERIKK